MAKLRMFIGSSKESVKIAEALQSLLEHDVTGIVWHHGVFDVSSTTIESLIDAIRDVDCAAFVFGPDDDAKIRGNEVKVARDNVIYELGLFTGHLGRKRCFIVQPTDFPTLHTPSDLTGVTPATFETPGNLDDYVHCLGPAANKIKAGLSKIYQEERDHGKSYLAECIEGTKGHYDLALAMLKDNPTDICLIQISSSFLLGPEADNPLEEQFLNTLTEQIAGNAHFIHVTTLGGTASHYRDSTRSYPLLQKTLKHLASEGDNVLIKCGKRKWPVRIADSPTSIHGQEILRLAPAMIAKYKNKTTHGLCVATFGESKTCFQIAGPKMDEFFRQCSDFASGCGLLKMPDLIKHLKI